MSDLRENQDRPKRDQSQKDNDRELQTSEVQTDGQRLLLLELLTEPKSSRSFITPKFITFKWNNMNKYLTFSCTY